MPISSKQGDSISSADRGFLYGDGVFETIRLINHQLTLLPAHLERLSHACDLLGIELSSEKLKTEIDLLVEQSPANGVVKIIVTRGSGGRGYQPPQNSEPCLLLQYHQLPDDYSSQEIQGVRIKMCKQVLSTNSVLAGIKHLGRLDQVLASAELDPGFSEGLMTTDDGLVIEATKSNLFVVIDDQLLTPALNLAGVCGVMRNFLIEKFNASDISVAETTIIESDLLNASEMFLCNSVFGVWPVTELVHGPQDQGRTTNLIVGKLCRLALGFAEHEFGKHR